MSDGKNGNASMVTNSVELEFLDE
jgi:hypothetical protein